MKEPLVSVVVPCYNVEAYIKRFFGSLLSQTYKRLEIVLVNDGSTDSTEDIIQEYIPVLEKEGFGVIYVKQENGGLSAAINAGIKHVSGDFMTWPDPDDWLTADSIEKRVRFLQAHPEAAMVRCNIEKIEEGTEASLGVFEPELNQPVVIEHFFEKLRDVKTWFGAHACLVRMTCFNEVNPEHDIYVHRRSGQNLQMLLPIAKKFTCWQLPDVLGYYLVRSNSHSHSPKTLEEWVAYNDMTEEVVINTLLRIPEGEESLKLIKSQYAWQRVFLAKRHGSFADILHYVKKAWPVVDEKLLLVLAPVIPRFIFRFCKKKIFGA